MTDRTTDSAASIDADRVDRLAETLIAARTEHRPLGPLTPDLAPTSEAEAAAVDDRVAELSGWPVMGWKIGCTSDHAQEMLGASGPFAGRVYSLWHGDTTLGPSELLTDPNLEGEFAFTLGADLAPMASAHDEADPDRTAAVIDAVANVRPAIELVGGRFARFVGTPLLDLVADAGANSLLIVGEPTEAWTPDGLAAASASMEVDGNITGRGIGADVLGGPVAALRWLVDHLGRRGITLHQGQIVTTGTATQVSALPVGSTATATLEGVGSISLTRR